MRNVTQFITDALFPGRNPDEIWVSILKTKTFYMKQIQFTLQFVILLAAIPLLVFVQFKHDNHNTKESTQTESETAYTEKPSGSGDVFLSAAHLVVK